MMSSPLRSYYLQQMGIQTWVERQTGKEKALASLRQQADCSLLSSGNPDAKLMLIGREPVGGKAALLLTRMLSSIGIDEKDVFIASSDSTELMARQVALIAPQVLLILGEGEYDPQTRPCLNSFHPEHLLKHPKDKKSAFRDLLTLKALLA